MKRIFILLIACLIIISCASVDDKEVYSQQELRLTSLRFQYNEHDMVLFYTYHRDGFSVLHDPECAKCKSKNVKDFNSIYDFYGN